MITPIFRIFDIEKAKDFYINYLGFQEDWSHQFEENMPLYFQISLNEINIHLSEHHGDATPGSAIRINILDVNTYHTALFDKVYSYSKPKIERKPWNTIEFTVIDPFSNRITFYENVK